MSGAALRRNGTLAKCPTQHRASRGFPATIARVKRPSASSLATPDIDAIWRRAAERVGFMTSRTQDAYATSNGAGEIAIGADDTLDDDDAFAQLVFHELCHAITEGEGALRQPDWGLDNVPAHAVREHACLRLQAYLAGRFGLRALMAPTTPYRAYYATLPRGSAGRRTPTPAMMRRRARARGAAALRAVVVARADRSGAGRDRGGGRRGPGARGRAPARFPARPGERELRQLRVAVRRRARPRRRALPAERARQRRRDAHRAQPPGVRALGGAGRLPGPAAPAAARPTTR